MTRRFEFVGGNSAKFWEIEINNTSVIVRYGRLGTNGQQQEKHFADTAAAHDHAEKLVAEKTRKGYRETAAA
ncbi:MAG TPA: WGR domain-containing protein [Pirellulales bacterium]|jgi:predicted DNA-binding WGR domain protein